MTARTVLFCTVGGSHQPIVKAIQGVRPEFVCFVCSLDDPATGATGSWKQVEGEGLVIKAAPKDAKPSLPNIPTQTGLERERFTVLKVPADNFDAIYDTVRQQMRVQRGDRDRIVADYTGGTKTMSAALAVAALDEGADLYIVGGARPDLDRVADGTESVMSVPAGAVRFRREIERALTPWKRHAYAEAEVRLVALHPPSRQDCMALHARARGMSRVFARWDAFAHMKAWQELAPFRDLLCRRGHAGLVEALRALKGEDAKGEALRIVDLWRNAERRAAAGRFDDAVARWYRMVEWAAQWLLRVRADISTADVPQEKALDEMRADRDGRIKVGLMDAWQLAARWADKGGYVADFWKENEHVVRDHVKLRNDSVLAHGFRSLGWQEWEKVREWTVSRFLGWWKDVADIRRLPDQLPNDGEAFFSDLET